MNKKRWWLIALLTVVALLAAACGDDGDDTGTAQDTETTEAKVPEFEAGTTMADLQQKGKLIVGTKYDQPGFGLKEATEEVKGFDVEIAKLIGEALFGPGGADKVEFTEAVSAVRESVIQDGKVDLVIATYTINDTRKQVVDFAGPYFVAEQDIMVRSDNTTIKDVDDLNGKKVCTAQGSTSLKNIQAKAPRADLSITFKTYSECAQALADRRVEAVSTDNTILAGLVDQAKAQPVTFKLLEAPFSEEPYGIGLKKGDQEFRDFLNDTLEKMYDNGDWADAFEATLGEIGLDTPEPPEVDRYTSGTGGAGTSTTASGAGGTTTSTAKP